MILRIFQYLALLPYWWRLCNILLSWSKLIRLTIVRRNQLYLTLGMCLSPYLLKIKVNTKYYTRASCYSGGFWLRGSGSFQPEGALALIPHILGVNGKVHLFLKQYVHDLQLTQFIGNCIKPFKQTLADISWKVWWKYHPNWINWRSCKHFLKNEWTLTEEKNYFQHNRWIMEEVQNWLRMI